jgi:hypothetical protein
MGGGNGREDLADGVRRRPGPDGRADRWKTSRYDLKDAAIDSAWTLARGRRTAENPTALEAKFNEIRSQPTWTGKATSAAGTAAGHFAAQLLGVVALVLMLAGLALAVFGFFWG